MKSQQYVVALCAVVGSLAASSAWSAKSEAQVEYERQKADCVSGRSNEDKATCMKEAGAALAEAKRGELTQGNANYRKNEMARCKALTGSEQSDCSARMKGNGTVSGSVSGGGMLREKTTTTIGSPGSITVAPAAASGAK